MQLQTEKKNTLEASEKKNQIKKEEDSRNKTTNRNNNNDNRDNQNKTNVYIPGDSMVKKLSGYFLT